MIYFGLEPQFDK